MIASQCGTILTAGLIATRSRKLEFEFDTGIIASLCGMILTVGLIATLSRKLEKIGQCSWANRKISCKY